PRRLSANRSKPSLSSCHRIRHLGHTPQCIILRQRGGPGVPATRPAECGDVDFLCSKVLLLLTPAGIVDSVGHRLKSAIAHRRACLNRPPNSIIELEGGLPATGAAAGGVLPAFDLERRRPIKIVVLQSGIRHVVAWPYDFRQPPKGIIDKLRRGRLTIRVPYPPHLAKHAADKRCAINTVILSARALVECVAGQNGKLLIGCFICNRARAAEWVLRPDHVAIKVIPVLGDNV